MKKMFLSVALVMALVLTSVAQITITSPAAGAHLPANGQISFWWSNSVPLMVSLHLERVTPDSGELLEVIPLVGKGYYHAGVDYLFWGTYSEEQLKVGVYHLFVSGVTPDGQYFEDRSDRFYVTTPAKMSCEDLGTSDWVSGTRQFRISWNGFEAGTPYSVLLLLASDYISEGYGFTLDSSVLPSERGSIILEAQFPGTNMSYYPPEPSTPVDGTYQVLFWESRTYGRAYSGPVQIAVSQAQLRTIEHGSVATTLHHSAQGLEFSIDTTYASNVIRSVKVPFRISSESTNSVFRCALYDGNGKRVSGTKTLRANYKGYATASLTAQVRIKPGTKKSFELKCTPIKETGRSWFRIDRAPLVARNGDGKRISIGALSYAGTEINVLAK